MIDGKEYSAGTLVLLTGRNLDHQDNMIRDLDSIAINAKVEILGVNSSVTEKGPDPGSMQYVLTVKKPEVAMLVGPPVHAYSAGELWFLFDRETELLVSGYASKENLGRLAGKIAVGVVPMGKGKIVYILDNTQFRMFWRGPSRMVQNAVMLLPEPD